MSEIWGSHTDDDAFVVIGDNGTSETSNSQVCLPSYEVLVMGSYNRIKNLLHIHWVWWFGSVLASSVEGWHCGSGCVKVCGSAVNKAQILKQVEN